MLKPICHHCLLEDGFPDGLLMLTGILFLVKKKKKNRPNKLDPSWSRDSRLPSSGKKQPVPLAPVHITSLSGKNCGTVGWER